MGISATKSHMKPIPAKESWVTKDKTWSLKWKKLKYKRNETKEQNNYDTQPSTSLPTSSSELQAVYCSTSDSTVPLYTSNDMLKAEVFYCNFLLFAKTCRWVFRVK